MHIKTERSAYLMVLLCCFCLGAVCAMMYCVLNAPILYVIILFSVVWGVCILPFAVATCREIRMDNSGCKVRFLFFSRFYSWQDLVLCKKETYTRVNYKSPYDEAIIFSTHHIKKPGWMKPLEYAFLSLPGSFFFVHFVPAKKELYEDKINGFPLLCCVDKEEFLKKMAEWHVTISE